MSKKTFKSEFFTESIQDDAPENEIEVMSDPYTLHCSFNEALEGWEKQAMDVMESYGYEVPARGLFSYKRSEIIEEEARDARGVIDKVRSTRKKISGTNKHALALEAIQLGLAVGKAHVRKYEKPAKTGRKNTAGGKKGRDRRTPKATVEQMKNTVDQIYKNNPHWKITTIRIDAAKQLGISDRWLRNQTKKYNPTK